MDQLAVEREDGRTNWRCNSFNAADTMVSNTGCASVCDWLITRRISLVAVCCSSASFVSLNRRTFSIAITAWSAKVWSSATCRSVKSSTLVRRRLIDPIATPSRNIGTTSCVRPPCCRENALVTGNSFVSVCTSAMCTVCPSSVARPLTDPRTRGRVNSPTGPVGIWP